jgi:predicted nucleotidyltransferase
MVASAEIRGLILDMVEKLVRDYAPERVILFGSHAWGQPGPDSDIDLLIVKDTTERFLDRWSTVRRILSDSKRKVGLDILVLTPPELSRRLAVRDQFIAKIMEEGELLYGA